MQTGTSEATITYVRVPDFTGRSYSEAKAWAEGVKVKIAVNGDPRTENIVSQSRVTPKALKAGDYSEMLTVTTGGYQETPAPKNDHSIWWALAVAAAYYIIKK